MASWVPGQVITRPGVYTRITNAGGAQPAGVAQGVVAVALRATWGPLASPVVIESLAGVDDTFGTGLGTDAAREVLYGGALRVIGVRVGAGGVKASKTLNDGAAAPVGRADAKYVGVRGNSLYLTLRTSLTDATKKEALLYELVGGAYTLRQTITFPKASGDDMAGLVTAGAGSPWVDFVKTATGSGVLADVTQVALNTVTGTAPTVTGTEYGAALTALETESWNALVLDSVDTSIQATAKAYIDRIRTEGKRRMLVVAEPTSVSLATREADARGFNDPAVVYAANGFTGSDGVDRDGYTAGARVAGMLVNGPVTRSLTHAPVANATAIVGALTSSDIEAAINAGAVVFTTNALGQIVVEYGITTFVTPTADLDAGWKKIRRVRTRDDLLNRIDASWAPLIGQVNNDPDGRASLIAVAQGVVNEMIAERALLDGGVTEDPDRPAAGDTAYFAVAVNDLDSAEKVLLTAAFAFSPA